MDRTVPTGAAILLDFIRKTETGKIDRTSYDVIYGHNEGKLAKPITSMTIGDLVDAQANFTTRFKSSAAGGYQFMRATLQDLSKELGLRGSQVFEPDLQDRLGYHLLIRRGYADFMAGKINRTEFGKRLAQEWASFPILASTKGAHRSVKRGETYYAGDALNKALVAPERVEAILDTVKREKTAMPEKPAAKPSPQPVAKSKRFWSWFGTGGGVAAIPFVDWRVQMLIAAVILIVAGYAIFTMPQAKAKLEKLIESI